MPTLRHPVVGAVRWEPGSGESIRLLDHWTQRNITTVYIKELDGVPTYGGHFNGIVEWYQGAADQLAHAWHEVARQELRHLVIFWGGSFVPRRIRGGSSPSNHSFGTAFDINPDQNPFHGAPAKKGQRGYLLPLVPIFKDHGFLWGGDWRSPDGMHFEVSSTWHPTPRPEPAPAPASPAQPVILVKDNRRMGIPAELRNGSVWVPAKAFAQAIGLSLGWVASSKVVTLNGAPITTELRDGAAWCMARQLADTAHLRLAYDPKATKLYVGV